MEREAEKLGLHLNHAKSEIISHDHRAVTSMLEAVPDLYPVRPELATLLVSALGLDDEVMRVAMGLCLGASLCHPHECHLCGAGVDH